jgi:hypothetical protein
VVVSGKTTGNAAASASTSQGSSGLAAAAPAWARARRFPAASVWWPAHTLPSNPNGYFVPVSQPGAHYLIETNPLMGVDNNATGSIIC